MIKQSSDPYLTALNNIMEESRPENTNHDFTPENAISSSFGPHDIMEKKRMIDKAYQEKLDWLEKNSNSLSDEQFGNLLKQFKEEYKDNKIKGGFDEELVRPLKKMNPDTKQIIHLDSVASNTRNKYGR